jgi:hypothetical protein
MVLDPSGSDFFKAFRGSGAIAPAPVVKR